MNVVACTTQTNPCPPSDQVLVSLSDAVDLAALGLTSAGLTQAFAWGVAAVLGLWAVGWVVGVVVGVIRKA